MSIVNYVTNSGFESGLTGWVTSGTVTLNSSYSQTGSNSAQIAGGTAGSYIYKLVNVPDSNSFELMVSLSKNGSGLGPSVFIGVFYFTPGLVYQNTGLIATVPSRLPDGTANNWKTAYFNVEPAFSGATVAQIFIMNSLLASSVDLFVDDVQLLNTALDLG
ncbi:NTTRR-F1 domain [Paenibacillus sp. MMO-58]|uniref:NTTRR-F1 domain n=1 Tax=Paenibacillus sp. MMO-58 TaxID=3081290 RepID=UPI003016D57A